MNAAAIDSIVQRHLQYDRASLWHQALDRKAIEISEHCDEEQRIVDSWIRVKHVIEDAERDLYWRAVMMVVDPPRQIELEAPEVNIIRDVIDVDAGQVDTDCEIVGVWVPRRVLRSGRRHKMERVRPYPPRR